MKQARQAVGEARRRGGEKSPRTEARTSSGPRRSGRSDEGERRRRFSHGPIGQPREKRGAPHPRSRATHRGRNPRRGRLSLARENARRRKVLGGAGVVARGRTVPSPEPATSWTGKPDGPPPERVDEPDGEGGSSRRRPTGSSREKNSRDIRCSCKQRRTAARPGVAPPMRANLRRGPRPGSRPRRRFFGGSRGAR